MSVLSFDGKNDSRVIGNGSGKLEKCDDASTIFFQTRQYIYFFWIQPLLDFLVVLLYSIILNAYFTFKDFFLKVVLIK